MTYLTSFDLFAGAGGLSLGLKWAGIKPIYALEQDKWAAETYAANNPDVQVQVEDIQRLSDESIAELGKNAPDIIVGGPPCQGFSHSNTLNRDPKDPRNSLFKDFIRFAKIVQPKICLIENVPGLLRTKLADGTYAIDAIKSSFSEIGYTIDSAILNSAQYGVPQKRERLFIVARKDGVIDEQIIWPPASHGETPSSEQLGLWANLDRSVHPFVTLWDAISDLPQIYSDGASQDLIYRGATTNSFQEFMRTDAPTHISNHEPMRHTSRITERFESIGLGQSESDAPEHLRPRRRSGGGVLSDSLYDQNSRRQYPDAPCNSMVASSHTNFIHPYLHRNFTVREMMRIQSFPDHFIVRGKRAVLSKKLSIRKGYTDDIYLDQRAQIGNAVPPLLARAVGTALCSLIIRCSKDGIDVI